MFAERADEIFRKLITLVNISAHLAYESFLAFRCRLWFYIVLIVVVGHGLDFGDHAGLGNAADEHSVSAEIHIVFYLQGHESIDITYNYAHLFPSKQAEMADKLDMERGE